MNLKLFSLFFVILVVSIAVNAQLPPAIQRIIEANQQDAQNTLENISFLIAFLAGVLSIFSPCTMALLPAFFSYSFKEKHEITKMTLVFFAGFALSFVGVGLLIVFLGKTSFAFFQQSTTGIFVQIVGAILILFGIFSIFGKGFSGMIFNMKTQKDVPGVFLFGMMFALGWTACIGPIIASILLMGTILHNYWYTAFLLFFYTLGVAVPLFIMAYFYDRYNWGENKWIQGKLIKFNLLGIQWTVHTTHLISGSMFIVIGTLFIVNKGTSVINILDLFGTLATLAFLFFAVYLIYKFALLRIKQENIRKALLIIFILAALFIFNWLRVTFGLRTLGWAEIADRALLNATTIYNVIGLIVLICVAVLVWMAIKSGKK